MSKIEIVPDEMGTFKAYGNEYNVCAVTDVVIRFVDSEFDYFRYLCPEQRQITLHWLGKQALSAIVAFGIPETRQRLKMQRCEFEEYVSWNTDMAMGDFESEFE